MTPALLRPAWADVDLAALAHNVRALAVAAGAAELCAVVKADAYGHGAVEVARAALAAGATRLAVALVEEGVALREAGIEAPILLLSEPGSDGMPEAIRLGLTPTVYTATGVRSVAKAASDAGHVVGVHLKLDTGMHRVGAPFEIALDLARQIVEDPALALEAAWTHFAVADDATQSDFTAAQVESFDRFCQRLDAAGHAPGLRHAANSAGLLYAGATYGMVRPGIALYGYAPNPDEADPAGLRPVLSLVARVTLVRELEAGEGLSYGLRHRLASRSTVATVPLGYADGVPRRLSEQGGEVLIAGRRRPIVGAITMDQLMVDCGPDADVRPGDEVVFLGRQGAEMITADDWARRLGTISYEILCGIGPRVPRVYQR